MYITPTFTIHIMSNQNKDHFQRLRHAYPGSKLLIVSNTAGTDSDKQQKEAAILEANTGIKVLRHSTKKPGCKEEVMAYFKAHPDAGVTRPDQIAVVGDRLSTDIMMANMMGSYGVWVRDGVTGRGFVSRALSQTCTAIENRRPIL
jgi:phosphatidylglycerophosphatase GEP4